MTLAHYHHPDDDWDDEGDAYAPPDEWEEAEAACSQFLDGGVIVCGALGSEWCDFECPLRRDLGLTPKEAEQRAIDEITAEVKAEREAKGSAEYDSWFTFDGSDDISERSNG